jgi:hypothetical protein
VGPADLQTVFDPKAKSWFWDSAAAAAARRAAGPLGTAIQSLQGRSAEPGPLRNPRDREHAYYPGQTSSRIEEHLKSALEKWSPVDCRAQMLFRKKHAKVEIWLLAGCCVQDLPVFWPSEATFLL